MIHIELVNKTIFRINKKSLDKILQKAENVLKLKKTKIISLSIVGEKEIRKLNNLYRGKDKSTDVLSFEERMNFPHPKEYLGDILICGSVAKKQAKQLKHSFEKEVNRLALHGFLHLLGFDHVKTADAVKMEALEEKILCLI